MKILFLTQLLPYPLDTGGRIKTYQTLKILSFKNEIHLVCFTPKKEDLKNVQKLQRVCQRIKVFVWSLTTANYRDSKWVLFKNFFSSTPFTVFRYHCPAAKEYLDRLFLKNKFDLVWIDHTNMAQYLPKKKNCTWVLDEHNIETLAKAKVAKWESSLIFKAGFTMETLKLFFYERRIIPKFDFWYAISEPDRQTLIRWGAKKQRTFVLPIPFQVNPVFSFKNKSPVVLFMGLLSWWPNRDGICWFYKKVWPRIKEKLPSSKFLVVGDGAKSFMLNWNNKDQNVILTGYVKDITPYLARAGVLVAPLRMGGGIKIKILTAMAAGIPVVSTQIASEGLDVKDRRELILADKPAEFAESVFRVLVEKDLAEKISKNGLNFIREKYNQKKALETLKKSTLI